MSEPLMTLEGHLHLKIQILPRECRRVCFDALDRYKRTLPAREYVALLAWLGTFFPYQLAWVLETARHAISNKGRQIGMSHASAAAAVLWSVFHGELTVIISKTDDAALETFIKAKKHAEVLREFGSRLAEPTRDKNNELWFRGGGRIKSRPSTGAQGDTGNVIIDEFAYHEDQGKTWDRAAAATTHGSYRLRVISTPNGIGNKFHEIATAAIPVEESTEQDRRESKWILHTVPMARAIREGMPVDLPSCWQKANGDARIFAQLYECKFLDGDQQYIPSGAITDARISNLYVAPGVGAYFAGLDIGREHDLTALIVVNYDGKLARTRWIRTMQRTDHAGLLALVDEAFATFPISRLSVDATGLGTFPAEEMGRRHGTQRVEAVTFSSASKELLATTLHDAIVNGWVRIPDTDAAVRDATPGSADGLVTDLCSLRRIILPGGGIRYDAPRSGAGHADRAWALALALYGITTAPAARRVSFEGTNGRAA